VPRAYSKDETQGGSGGLTWRRGEELVRSDGGWERRFGSQGKGAPNRVRQAQRMMPLHVKNHHCSPATSRTTTNTLLSCGKW
jgi:hypothetical protein